MQEVITNFVSAGGNSLTATTGHSATPINIWVVDDNRRMRDTLLELFERCQGIRCTAAFSSPNAVLSALASRVGPDVILLDMHLGDHNGLDAIRPIKSLSRSTHVLMFTTFFDAQCREKALMSGASDFLLKSFPLEKIIAAIRQAWSRPAPHLKKVTASASATDSLKPANEDLTAKEVVNSHPVRERSHSRSQLAWVKNCLDLIRATRS
jgi:DNA-binding NarL/FixJ family response regulator